MNEPATERAVQTTPPMMSAAIMPLTPFSPTATMTTEARMSVMSVMPLTGLDPTMAMALAATVVKRKDMMTVSRMATRANIMLPPMTPNQKNRKVLMTAVTRAMPIKRKLRSLSVRGACSSLWALLVVCVIREMLPLMMSHDLMMPIMPDMAMAPMPMLLP